MSGADMSAVDALRGLRIQERARGQLSPSLANGTSVSCCSCCCCCCGETAVISA
jgi:hypothetical protein